MYRSSKHWTKAVLSDTHTTTEARQMEIESYMLSVRNHKLVDLPVEIICGHYFTIGEQLFFECQPDCFRISLA